MILLNLDGFVKSIEMEKNDLIYELMQKEEFKILNKFLEYIIEEDYYPTDLEMIEIENMGICELEEKLDQFLEILKISFLDFVNYFDPPIDYPKRLMQEKNIKIKEKRRIL